MATVRITLAAAGLLVCGVAFANGTAAETVPAAESAVSPVAAVAGKAAEAHPPAENTLAAADPDAPEAPAAVKPKSARAKGISRKTAKTAPIPKASIAAKPLASGRMQVEEPKANAPMSPARESKAWQKSHSRGLTEAQKKAFRERKENMEGMIAVIKEKRKALRDAKPEDRAALARELHSLILEKDPAAALATASPATARVAPVVPENARAVEKNGADANSAAAQASQREDAKKAKAEEATERRRKRDEDYQEQQRKKD